MTVYSYLAIEGHCAWGPLMGSFSGGFSLLNSGQLHQLGLAQTTLRESLVAKALGVPDSHEACLSPWWWKLLGSSILLSFQKGRSQLRGSLLKASYVGLGDGLARIKCFLWFSMWPSLISVFHWVAVAPGLYSKALSEPFSLVSSCNYCFSGGTSAGTW